MKCGRIIGIIFLLSYVRLGAQQESPHPLTEFEVASIKPVDPNTYHTEGVEVYPGGRVVINGLSLKGLIHVAFHLAWRDISGCAPWMEKDLYNIEARPPEDQITKIRTLKHGLFSIEDQHLREMLQALLISRFHLTFHSEEHAGTVYLLKRSGKTLRLHATESDAAAASFSSIGYAGARWVITGTTMPELAKYAGENVLHEQVIDQTGLTGIYEYWQHDLDPDPQYGNASYTLQTFQALMAEVGLKLERSQGRITTLIVDSASKPLAN
jgi:uncharacterized protein (TIGR03435 family)